MVANTPLGRGGVVGVDQLPGTVVRRNVEYRRQIERQGIGRLGDGGNHRRLRPGKGRGGRAHTFRRAQDPPGAGHPILVGDGIEWCNAPAVIGVPLHALATERLARFIDHGDRHGIGQQRSDTRHLPVTTGDADLARVRPPWSCTRPMMRTATLRARVSWSSVDLVGVLGVTGSERRPDATALRPAVGGNGCSMWTTGVGSGGFRAGEGGRAVGR